MLRNFLMLTALAAGAFAQGTQAQKAGPPITAARPLPITTIKTPDAKGISLRKYRGKEVILVLFSTQCDDCVTTMGYMTQIQNQLGARVQVIGVGVNKNAPYEIGPWTQRYKPSFPIGFLDQDSMLKLVSLPKDAVPYVPIVIYIDATGMIRTQFTGDTPIFKDRAQMQALRATAESLLKWQTQHAAGPKADAK